MKQLMLFEGIEAPEAPVRKPYALFSPCVTHPDGCDSDACQGKRFRYRLYWPTGIDNDRTAVGCFANPSTATAEETDPTVAKWIKYCRAWGYGWAGVVNVRAWRSTDPKGVPADPEGIGPDNATHIAEAVITSEIVVCGWGKLGGELGPVTLRAIRDLGRTPLALARNQDGSPQHPLYLKDALKPFTIFEPGDIALLDGREVKVERVSRSVVTVSAGLEEPFEVGAETLQFKTRGDT